MNLFQLLFDSPIQMRIDLESVRGSLEAERQDARTIERRIKELDFRLGGLESEVATLAQAMIRVLERHAVAPAGEIEATCRQLRREQLAAARNRSPSPPEQVPCPDCGRSYAETAWCYYCGYKPSSTGS